MQKSLRYELIVPGLGSIKAGLCDEKRPVVLIALKKSGY
jgi:hypothetical protein